MTVQCHTEANAELLSSHSLSYRATKSDYYTHVRDIPPQYGEGYFDINDEVCSFVPEKKSSFMSVTLSSAVS